MCHGVRVNLSPEEKAYAKRFSGMMIPLYAVVVLTVVVIATLVGSQRPDELVASSAPPPVASVK